ncbi:MAG: hypothetical protein AB7F19_07825 [Candidatus Babeliales bacterium]
MTNNIINFKRKDREPKHNCLDAQFANYLLKMQNPANHWYITRDGEPIVGPFATSKFALQNMLMIFDYTAPISDLIEAGYQIQQLNNDDGDAAA